MKKSIMASTRGYSAAPALRGTSPSEHAPPSRTGLDLMVRGLQSEASTELRRAGEIEHVSASQALSVDLSDQQLLEQYAGGSEQALEVLIVRHRQKIFGFLIQKVKDEEVANDLFQEVFIKVIRTLKTGRYNEEGKFLPWVLRIAHNLAIDHFRRVKRQPLSRSTDTYDVFGSMASTERNREDDLVHERVLADALKLLEYLPEEQQSVLRMRIYEDLSFKEIAEQTGVSINTALGRMRYALINLRKLIAKHGVILEL
jgi:RNA polymerase sigma-70 factor (ECF subfamily)